MKTYKTSREFLADQPAPVDSGRTDPRDGTLGACVPGDTHVNPNPYEGRGLSKNPKQKISPQTMPETLYGQYEAPDTSSDGTRRESKGHAGLRKLAKR